MTTKKLIKSYYSLLDDLMSRGIFGDPRNIECTKHFIKSVTNFSDEILEGIVITNGETLTKNSILDKELEIDIKLRLKSGINIILEFQNKNDIDSEIKNILYSMNELMTQVKRGDKYSKKLKPVYQIIVVNNDTLRSKLKRTLLNTCQISNLSNNEYIILKNYYIIKILDINGEVDYVKDSKELIDWIKMFKAKSWEELEEVSKGKEMMEKVRKSMEQFLGVKWVRTIQDKMEDTLRMEKNEARESGLEEGRVEGRKEGITEGLEKGRIEEKIKLARIMYENSEPIDKISLYTDFTNEEIIKVIGLSYDESLILGKKTKRPCVKERTAIYNANYKKNL